MFGSKNRQARKKEKKEKKSRIKEVNRRLIDNGAIVSKFVSFFILLDNPNYNTKHSRE